MKLNLQTVVSFLLLDHISETVMPVIVLGELNYSIIGTDYNSGFVPNMLLNSFFFFKFPVRFDIFQDPYM